MIGPVAERLKAPTLTHTLQSAWIRVALQPPSFFSFSDSEENGEVMVFFTVTEKSEIN